MKKRKSRILGELAAVVIAIFVLAPIYIVFVNAFKTRAELYDNALALPKTWTFEYFATAMEKMEFVTAFLNSVFVTVISIVLIIVCASMCAWMLARTKSRLSSFLFMSFIATMLIPFQTIMMPLVQTMHKITALTGIPLLNSRGGLIFMYIGFGMSIAIFLFHGFVSSVPLSLEEAAKIDGCSKFSIFWRIVFPLLKPTTVTVMILDVIWIWNDYLLPSLVLSDKALRTIPLSTQSFFGQFTIKWNMAMAGLTLTIIPVVIFYICAQKYIIKGVAAGAVK